MDPIGEASTAFTPEAVMFVNRCAAPIAVAFLLSILGSGCAGERLVPVTGTVLCQGKPLANLVITFVPDKGPKSYSVTDKSGNFKMVCTDGREGVIMGRHKVFVNLNASGSKDNPALANQVEALRADPVMVQMLQKYGSAELTPLEYVIEDGLEGLELKLD